MTTLSFGDPDDGDLLVIQGVTYHRQPVGMRTMRKMLTMYSDGELKTTESLDAAIDLLTASVVPDERDALREHVEDRVGPALLTQIVRGLISTGVQSDLDPTQPASSSDGLSTAGPASTDGAGPVASTRST